MSCQRNCHKHCHHRQYHHCRSSHTEEMKMQCIINAVRQKLAADADKAVMTSVFTHVVACCSRTLSCYKTPSIAPTGAPEPDKETRLNNTTEWYCVNPFTLFWSGCFTLYRHNVFYKSSVTNETFCMCVCVCTCTCACMCTCTRTYNTYT